MASKESNAGTAVVAFALVLAVVGAVTGIAGLIYGVQPSDA